MNTSRDSRKILQNKHKIKHALCQHVEQSKKQQIQIKNKKHTIRCTSVHEKLGLAPIDDKIMNSLPIMIPSCISKTSECICKEWFGTSWRHCKDKKMPIKDVYNNVDDPR